MPFPFWWGGALVAAIVLGTAFTLFGIATRLLARAADEIRDSVLPGLVSGLRDWTRYPVPRGAVSSPRASSPSSFSPLFVPRGPVSPGVDPGPWPARSTSRTDEAPTPEPAVVEEITGAASTPTEPVLRR